MAKTKGAAPAAEPEAPQGPKEFPKTLHGVSKGEAVSKIVNDAEEEAAARKKGWGDVPKQDHGPTLDEQTALDVDPVLDKKKK